MVAFLVGYHICMLLSHYSIMSDRPEIAVSSLRSWLEDVQNQLSPTKWSLLLLCYLAEFPYGRLEQLQDTADLYNKLIEKHHFTPDESFQLLLRRLSLLKEDGRNCILALARYDLPQSESIPDLSSKLSPVSRLVECIVKTLVELNAMQQVSLIHYLAWEHLKTNAQNLSLLELFSKLIQRQIIGVSKTQAFIDGLKHIRTPPDALCHLRDYHEDQRLGEFEYCESVHLSVQQVGTCVCYCMLVMLHAYALVDIGSTVNGSEGQGPH